MDRANLTSEQMRAIEHSEGPACVVAGAGTGKTTTLSERIIYLIEKQRINPDRILVTTFTRKATSELYQRTYKRLGEKAQQLRISTIDALFWELAQKAMERGIVRSARLIGEANQRLLFLQCAYERFIADDDSSEWWFEKVIDLGLISLLEDTLRAKFARGKEKQSIQTSIRDRLNDRFSFLSPTLTLRELQEITEEYFKKLEALVATDYGLLSFDLLRCLTEQKSFVKQLTSEFQFDAILVDEFQDTSRIQAEILFKLSGRNRNIWVVGDPCQQIYEWRGAGPENLLWFIEKTKAKKYTLTHNYRSTQIILDSAYNFLNKRVPSLKKKGMLKKLHSKRCESEDRNTFDIFTGKLDQALFFISQFLQHFPVLKPNDIAILSRRLNKKTVEDIKQKARAYKLKLQFYSTRADGIIEETIGTPKNWKAGKALNGIYKHPKIQRFMVGSLRKRDFTKMRRLRPLAMAAEALDNTIPSGTFRFDKAWPALKITQDREITITPAVISNKDAIQVMTIHAAKGLEFPVVLLMKLGEGGVKSFPNPIDPESSRLVYVGATRARDLLIIVHTDKKPQKTLAAFGKNIVSIRKDRKLEEDLNIQSSSIKSSPPVIQASDLDLYEQCPLKFAAYHEGRFLPKWTPQQSKGARMHKAIELWLRAGMPRNQKSINQCFEEGIKLGDSPLRSLPKRSIESMRKAFQEILQTTLKTYKGVLEIESDYRYLHGNSGQIHGIVDAVLEKRDGRCVLKEWKSSSEIPTERAHQYELQIRAGALGLIGQNSKIDSVEIVPVFSPLKAKSMTVDAEFENRSKEMFDHVFKDIANRNYKPKRDKHCDYCDLKPYCPAWLKKAKRK